MDAPPYPMVFRHNSPRGFKARLCRIVNQRARVVGRNGEIEFNAGDNTVALEFDNGETLMAVRSSVVYADSRPGRLTAAKVARGDVRNDWRALAAVRKVS